MGEPHTRPVDEHLRRLDLLLHRQILRLRASYQLSLDEFRGLYISDEQVDSLIDAVGTTHASAQGPQEAVTVESLTARACEIRSNLRDRLDPSEPMARVRDEFKLSDMEFDLILLATAPDIDTKYETLYAYLNNDVSRKWPTFHLATRIFDEDYPGVRTALMSDAPLFRMGLLRTTERAPDRISWLATPFAATPCLSHFLVGMPAPPRCFDGAASARPCMPEIGNLESVIDTSPPPLLVIEGRPGTGRRRFAEQICEKLGRPLRHLDLGVTPADEMHAVVAEAVIVQRLNREALYITGAELICSASSGVSNSAITLLERLTGSPTFLAVDEATSWQTALGGRQHIDFKLNMPEASERCALWGVASRSAGADLASDDLESLASRFILTPARIAQSALSAELEARRLGGGPDLAMFAQAAKAHSDRALAGLASRVETTASWEELVLPPPVLDWVRVVARAMGNRYRVFTTWGMARGMGTRAGLATMFAGASGTGKTMTAGVIANELGQEMYKIDLSRIVSKYIGETEKNLDQIFTAAKDSNALLFFDEADALFGKRSEVKDAHDRYANIEVAYLLQKLEEYEGVVILATNLSKNIDPAFARRMHFVVDFPLPSEQNREQLWRQMFPKQAPVDDNIDYTFIAKQFTLTGGEIKNAALTAAFLAENGEKIEMRHVVRALARQLIKQGRIPQPADFKQYYPYVCEEGG